MLSQLFLEMLRKRLEYAWAKSRVLKMFFMYFLPFIQVLVLGGVIQRTEEFFEFSFNNTKISSNSHLSTSLGGLDRRSL